MKQSEQKTLLKSQQGELDAVLMYNALADVVKDKKDAETFRRLASEEGHHAAVFRALTGEALKPKKTLATWLPILYKLLGKKRLYPIIENLSIPRSTPMHRSRQSIPRFNA